MSALGRFRTQATLRAPNWARPRSRGLRAPAGSGNATSTEPFTIEGWALGRNQSMGGQNENIAAQATGDEHIGQMTRQFASHGRWQRRRGQPSRSSVRRTIHRGKRLRGSIRSCIQPRCSYSRIAPGSCRTEIAHPRSTRIADRRSFVVEMSPARDESFFIEAIRSIRNLLESPPPRVLPTSKRVALWRFLHLFTAASSLGDMNDDQ
jgi:hypothetical protein